MRSRGWRPTDEPWNRSRTPFPFAGSPSSPGFWSRLRFRSSDPATIFTAPFTGTAGDDVINGLGGNDLICGRDGLDRLFGGEGNDTIYGDDGNDILTFIVVADTNGDDKIFGGRGNDIILDQVGANVAHGDGGNDSVVVTGEAYGDSGDDATVQAAETSTGAKDAIASGSTSQIINCGSGFDTLFGADPTDTVHPNWP
jgi:Ca2+-binding RTX toxin-like protein